jgi:peptide/nickel transport system ATP-binding protein
MLEIRDLSVRIGQHEIINIEALDIASGQRMGLVGESGSGKTITAMTIIGLLPTEAVVSGSITFEGRELIGLSDAEMSELRGRNIGVVFQDASRALNPTMRIHRQVSEVLRLHKDLSRAEIRGRVMELLTQVQLADPEAIFTRYPHQLSGGQQQRIMIAIAIASGPQLLIADEPTTALDVTVQEGILELLVQLSEDRDMGLLFVSHDLGVVRSVSDFMAVVYGGHLVEFGPADDVVNRPYHRYTAALVAANPGLMGSQEARSLVSQHLDTIDGSVPALGAFPSGCRFRGRCRFEIAQCASEPPVTVIDSDRRFKCWNPQATELTGRSSSTSGTML